MSKPEVGQWWFPDTVKPGESAGEQGVFVIGHRDDGKTVFQSEPQGLLLVDLNGWSGWHHEPRCTGWDWVVPEDPTPPANQPDPDEWVVLDPVKYADHVPRTGIDWFMNGKNEWILQESYHDSRTVGDHFRWCDKHHRCRRRDLPPVEKKAEPQPAKTRVRLWIDRNCNVHAGFNSEGDIEIHHDAEGFYVEDQQ